MPKKFSKKNPGKFLYNALLVFLTVVVLGFIYSFAQKSFSNGVSIQKPQLNKNQKEQLALDIYNNNPILDIKIEVMNGCGEKGVAHKIGDYLRLEQQLDVVRSENADNWDYKSTMLILRSNNQEKLETVADAIGFNINDKNRVSVKIDSDSDVDLTLLLGEDYNTVKPLKAYLDNLAKF